MILTARRRGALCAGGLALALVALAAGSARALSLEALFAPKAELWERWTAHDPDSTAVIDHGPWAAFLERYVKMGRDGVNRLAYGRVGAADMQALAGYIDRLAAVPISRFARPEQRAYWINVYNALTVKLVLDHYPVASIRDIDVSPGLFADGPWDRTLVEVEGERVSLNDIEHRILRPIWRDPRLHYAVNCASIGCPNLRRRAFTAANTEELLEAAARDYVNHPRGADVVEQELTVSSIYVWFAEDFGGDDAAVIAHLKRHALPALAARLAHVDRIAGHRYDWALNDAPGE